MTDENNATKQRPRIEPTDEDPTEPEVVIIGKRVGPTSGRIHTDPSCPSVKKMHDPQITTVDQVHRDAKLCLKCSGKGLPTGFEAAEETGECNSCGAMKDGQECQWCKRYEEVMGPYA